MTLTIDGHTITLRQTFRSHIIYEGITGKTFAPVGLTDIITFFYSDIMAVEPDLTLTFDDFLNWLDEHPAALTDYTQYLASTMSRNEALTPKAEETEPAQPDGTKKKQ